MSSHHINTVLVEVHRELATVRNGAKDMVTKNRCLHKAETLTKHQLKEAVNKIAAWEQELQTGQHADPPATKAQRLNDDLAAQVVIMAKAQNATENAEMEIGRLQDELRQASDWEKDIWATTLKAIKDLQEQKGGNFSAPSNSQSL